MRRLLMRYHVLSNFAPHFDQTLVLGILDPQSEVVDDRFVQLQTKIDTMKTSLLDTFDDIC